MATLAAQQIKVTGPDITYVAAAGGGDAVQTPDDRTFLRVNNGGGSPITVTVTVPSSNYEQALADIPVTVPNGEQRLIGPLGDYRLLIAGFNIVSWAYSAVTSVTVAVCRF